MNTKKNNLKSPELLAPAGSPEALEAAIAAGADAVYFGGSAFNARMGAKNFAGAALAEAFAKCRAAGVKTNVTLNTLVHTRELSDMLRAAEELYLLGADALIVADLGAAALLHRYFPDLELHASTQAAGHCTAAAGELAKLGFTRMVAARELSFGDLTTLCAASPIETELFIHGAICVSQSGQCLASSMIGGRSGNRGCCAQPCRLPYRSESGRESYALSLRDMCLASHMPELLSLGAASFKIEGRMKGADYVYGVTSIYRRLIDERRAALPEELETLRSLFSRSGFTDGYFVKKLGREMLGIRTDADKRAAKLAAPPAPDCARLAAERIAKRADSLRRPLDMKVELRAGLPCRLTVSCGESESVAEGPIPIAAINRPLTAEALAERLSRLGGTQYRPGRLDIRLDEGLMLPMSALNALRRDAVAGLPPRDEAVKRSSSLPDRIEAPELPRPTPSRTARFALPEEIPEGLDGFDIVYLPLERYTPDSRANGVILPPVIFDSQTDTVRAMLGAAKNAGIRHALVSNLGHIALAKEAGMRVHGDFRLNIYNPHTAAALYRLGFEELMSSPELTAPQLRSLGLPAVVYGRLPIMVLEKCCIRELYSCKLCSGRSFLPLKDRMGVDFPMIRSFEHRNIVYNSVPFYMADRMSELAGLGEHFIFSTETADEVTKLLAAYRDALPPDRMIADRGSRGLQIRRLPK